MSTTVADVKDTYEALGGPPELSGFFDKAGPEFAAGVSGLTLASLNSAMIEDIEGFMVDGGLTAEAVALAHKTSIVADV